MNNKLWYPLILAIKATPGRAFIWVKCYVFLSCQTWDLSERAAGTLMTATYLYVTIRKYSNIFQNLWNCFYAEWALHFPVIVLYWKLLQFSKENGLVDANSCVLYIKIKTTNHQIKPLLRSLIPERELLFIIRKHCCLALHKQIFSLLHTISNFVVALMSQCWDLNSLLIHTLSN